MVRFNATTLWHSDAAEWAPSTASLADVGIRNRAWLLWDTIDGKAAKCCVFVADFSMCNLRWVSSPSLDLFQTFPNLYGNPPRGLSIKSSYLTCGVSSRSSYRDEATSGSLDDGLSFRGVLLGVRVGISHIDF